MVQNDQSMRSKELQTAADIAAVEVESAARGRAGNSVASAASPYLRDLTLEAWREISEWRIDSAARVIRGAADELEVEPEEIVQLANANAERQEFFAEALFAASRTLNDLKINALARAVASGLTQNTGRVDHDRLIVAALAELEDSHIRLLLQMAPGRRGPYKSAYKWGWPAGLGKVLAPVAMETLARHALVESDELAQRDREFRLVLAEIKRAASVDDEATLNSGESAVRKPPKWRCSTFGAQCARFLTGRSDSVESE